MKMSVDLNGAKPGSVSYPLNTDTFNIPRGVTVARITPPVVHLRLEPVVKRTLPVSVRISGKPGAGYRIAETVARPQNVAVQGPAEEVRRLVSIETIPVDIEESRTAVQRRVRLSNDGKPLAIVPDQVEVSITIEEEQMTRAFDRVEVRARDFKGTYHVAPQSVQLSLSGPKNILDKLQLSAEQVYLDLKGLSVGEHTVALTLNLPAGVKVLEQKPQLFKVRITKPEA
jgi:YbbR domain-containing protein